MLWTYLSNAHIITSSTLNSLTIECVELDISESVLEDKLKDYRDLISDGFFNGFLNDYSELFVSSFGPTESPITKEKLFVIQLS